MTITNFGTQTACQLRQKKIDGTIVSPRVKAGGWVFSSKFNNNNNLFLIHYKQKDKSEVMNYKKNRHLKNREKNKIKSDRTKTWD